MKATYKFLVVGLLASWPVAASAAGDNKGTTAANTSAEAQLERMEKETTTVTFAKGSAKLSEAEQNKIKALIPGYAGDKNIDEVIVAAWSDQAYPAKADQKLPEAERDLAEERADVIEDLLDKNGVDDVDTYSMAEKPNWISRVFQTNQAQIKGQARDKGMDNLNEERISKILTSKGGPSKAVIIVKRETNQRTM
ncbi:hypothetical protein [Oligoflexus tunisiensis]|uniref:hypothetical protein n=1 Tax=Oligoflexus tunisiensis TaxID=708132 RepID=UPI00114D2369|nr:hypothetical protein [Oligoflexus tunisiensis]